MSKNYNMKWVSLLFTLSFFSLNQLSAQGYSNVGSGGEGPVGLILGLSGDVGGASITQSDQFQAQYTTEQYEEPSLFSFGVGVNAGVRLNNFYLLTGASYITRGGRVKGRVLGRNYTVGDGISPDQEPDDDQEVFIEDRTNINMLKVPVLAAYRFGSQKLAFRLSLGIAFNSMLGDRANFEREAEWRDEVAGDFVNGGRTNSDLFDVFLYGDDSRARFLPSTISFIFNPSLVFQIKKNSHLKIGVIYESFGDISNDRFSRGSDIVTGDQNMSYFGVQIGYEYRIEFVNY